MSNYQRAMEANRDQIEDTIDRMTKEIARLEQEISARERTKETLLLAKSAMSELRNNYEAEIAKG